VTDVNAPENPRGIGVLLHPHPDFGGDRFHPFIDGLFQRLPGAGVAALRFDFSSADTADARQEVVAAVDTGTTRWPGCPVVLVGYSFGTRVACGIDDQRIAAWYLLGPQRSALVDAAIGPDPRPKALVVPELDQFCRPAVVADCVADWVATTITVLPGTDHFLGVVDPVVTDALTWVATVVGR
jgi:alpha/beta superfamily hydrolase